MGDRHNPKIEASANSEKTRKIGSAEMTPAQASYLKTLAEQADDRWPGPGQHVDCGWMVVPARTGSHILLWSPTALTEPPVSSINLCGRETLGVPHSTEPARVALGGSRPPAQH